MSGTSLDGLDLVCVTFEKKQHWEFQILKAKTFSYNKHWRKKLGQLHTQSLQKIKAVEDDFIVLMASCILDFTKDLGAVDFVSSHGHTVFHQPDKGITLQIGNTAVLSKQINLPVVCDFRSQDVALGGQGAPLVPVGDLCLFKNYSACLNLGGFANVSKTKESKVIAYDICAVNTVMNLLAQEKAMEFDTNGALAKAGKMIPELFNSLESLNFYHKKYPKSLGLEWVNSKVLPILDLFHQTAVEDRIHTYAQHIAKQIASNFLSSDKILVSGGGAKNHFLITLLKQNSKANFMIPDSEVIDFKEALIFAFLGLLRMKNEVNCLASVTGSKRDHSSGLIFYPEK